jgi:D-amino peptidase
MAGHFKVPLVYLSGDEAACREAARLIPGIVTTSVKTGLGRNRAKGVHPQKGREMIRRDAARALSSRKFPKPLVWKKPLKVRVTFYRSDMADETPLGKNVKRLDARTLEKRTNSQLDILF